MSRSCVVPATLCAVAACAGATTEDEFRADLHYQVVTEAGGHEETNDLFLYGSPVALLVDSAVVAYADQDVGGSLAVVDIRERKGWSLHSPDGSDGPGELNGRVPLVSTVGDTIKAYRGDGRLIAWLRDGTFLFDSLIHKSYRPGMVSLTFGLAGNKRIADSAFPRRLWRLCLVHST